MINITPVPIVLNINILTWMEPNFFVQEHHPILPTKLVTKVHSSSCSLVEPVSLYTAVDITCWYLTMLLEVSLYGTENLAEVYVLLY
jgi:hypothetical protein